LKTKKRKKLTSQDYWFIFALAVVFLGTLALMTLPDPSKNTVSSTETNAINIQVVWTTNSLQSAYAPDTTTNDIVGDTLDRMDQLYAFVANELQSDANLIRLFSKERAIAITRDQFEADLGKLRGLELTFVGQLHESVNSAGYPIKEVQSHIAELVRELCDVMWTEEFTGGSQITAEKGCSQFIEESSESDIPAFRNFNDPESTKAYMMRSSPLHASFQLLFDPRSRIEVRGADYLPVKALQQHFMEYELPANIRGPLPKILTPAQKTLIMRTLSDVRNLYALRYIALNADRSKRNTLVLGTYHANHIAYIMSKYGVKCSFILPEVSKH